MPSCSMHLEYFEHDKQKALHRDIKYSEQFKIKAELTTIIILYSEARNLSSIIKNKLHLCVQESHLSSTISSENCYHKPANSRNGTAFTHVCPSIVLSTFCGAPCDHCL